MFLGFCIIPLLSIKFLRKQNETKNHFNPFQTNTFIIKNSGTDFFVAVLLFPLKSNRKAKKTKIFQTRAGHLKFSAGK
ncbi:hypothetical protein D1164_21295 [Mariniphaga sediminis]|uniref:Uncharacterized protein n=1 Tax=Mariniphaga sediminis TaxID=1628158 RepID=A0A399CXM2_9BACT|nr:hypothetical protein D1164_21295 [Mariniphaga sediminis]